MKTLLAVVLAAVGCAVNGQTPAAAKADLWGPLHFLEGTWQATAQGKPGVNASGVYTFRRELGNHVMARHSSSDPGCKGPAAFDCEHGDLLYVYESPAEPKLKAIYFDNEGHVIHYNVSSPAADAVVFQSQPGPGPQFRLVYELKSSVMSGKFQMQAPGQTNWNTYLEWSGARK